MILGIDTAGDDTCAALVSREGAIRASVVSSAGVVDRWGAAVDAGPRRHLALVDVVVEDVLARAGAELSEVRLVAVRRDAGLVGGLLAGVSAAKAIAATRGVPLVPVGLAEALAAAHLLGPDAVEPPFGVLVAEGGRTLLLGVPAPDQVLVLGATVDLAADEALAKGAALLGPDALPAPAAASALVPARDLVLAPRLAALAREVRDGEADGAAFHGGVLDAVAGWAIAHLAPLGVPRVALAAAPPLAAALADRLAATPLEPHALAPELVADRGAHVASAARFAAPLLPAAYLALAP